jgi:putative DNA methylase
MTTYRKKLIEVALPLEAINKAAAREKSIRHGHPSTLHLWWARRPLAACRAVLFASLVDDPDSDPAYRRADGSVDEDRAGAKRAQLFNLIEQLVQWENSNNETVINAARAEIARCVASRELETGELKKTDRLAGGETVWDLIVKGHGDLDAIRAGRWRLPRPEAVNAFLAEYAPPVLDPFCGGGSIPLEAQRLGLRAYASDLNPVAVLITKAMIEIPPKFAGMPPINPKSKTENLKSKTWHGAEGLAEDVRYYGKWMRDEAERRIGHLYPRVKITQETVGSEGADTYRPDLQPYVGRELTVIAWLWARTVTCSNPACGATLPLVGSMWLSKRPRVEAWLRPRPQQRQKRVLFDVVASPGQPRDGTVGRRGATCLCCGSSVPLARIREQGAARQFGVQLLAIVAQGGDGRVFLNADEQHAAHADVSRQSKLLDTPLPSAGLGFRVQLYGLKTHRDLYTTRQLIALETFSDLLEAVRRRVITDCGTQQDQADADHEARANEHAVAIGVYLALAGSKAADLASSLCHWQPNAEHLKLAATFMRPTLSMTWDYAEGNPFSDSSGNFFRQFELVEKVLAELPRGLSGHVEQHDAQCRPSVCAPIVSTDPPYYDNIGYADLSDFFYVWLRKSLASSFPQLLSTVLVPKGPELVADPSRHGSQSAAKAFFEQGLANAFNWMREITHSQLPLTLFYAFKQAEAQDGEGGAAAQVVASTGWEVMLESLISSGFLITGTIPFRTERTGRPRSNASNALASSIVLVCRARARDAALATRKELIAALRRELPEALHSLRRGNIAPVDLAQAAIGPGMAVFTRYSKVLESDGTPMTVRTALGLINQALDEVLAEQEGEFDADTRFALAWFAQFGMDEGPFGEADVLARAKNTAVGGLVEAGVCHARAGKVRLLRREELPADWNPATDKRLTVWEMTQHLIRRLDQDGESAAAALVRQLGCAAETARDLAYRLYTTCERKKWADEALAYNGLVIAWPELSKLAAGTRQTTEQTDFRF